jgi:hypothetical protein
MFSNKLEFKGAIIGMLLGDGCIPKLQGRSKECFLVVNHSIKQEDYLMHKKDLLFWLTECKVYKQDLTVKGNEYQAVRLQTRSHPFYTKLRAHFYHEGRKTVDEHLLKCLTVQGLALWYQDDGCLLNHEDFLTPYLCTHNFNKTEVELIARMLQKKFGLQWRLRKDKQYYALRLRRMDREDFFKLIAPFVHKSMQYKIRSDGIDCHEGYGKKVTLTCAHCSQDFEVPYRWRTRLYCGSKCYHNSRSEKHAESQDTES